MGKLQIEDARPPIEKIYEGKSVLKVPAGTLLEIVKPSVANLGDIALRTSRDTSYPLVTLETGGLWGMEFEGYHFKVIDNASLVLKK